MTEYRATDSICQVRPCEISTLLLAAMRCRRPSRTECARRDSKHLPDQENSSEAAPSSRKTQCSALSRV